MKPVLFILAAGNSSRYGRLKQTEPVGPQGDTIIDYTLFDAERAGFESAVLITSPGIVSIIDNQFNREKYKHKIAVFIAIQETPDFRQKPWGTGHAVLSACKEINRPFAVVNGDDFYGSDALKSLAFYLSSSEPDGSGACMIGYELNNTLSEYGDNSRGLCRIGRKGFLCGITEQTGIFRAGRSIHYLDTKNHKYTLSPNTIVSMNVWGFRENMYKLLNPLFRDFVKRNKGNPGKEFYLPEAMNNLIIMKKLTVSVKITGAQCFGLTYPGDRDKVKYNIKRLTEQGIYPEKLW